MTNEQAIEVLNSWRVGEEEPPVDEYGRYTEIPYTPLENVVINLAIQALEKQIPKKPSNQRYMNKELMGACSACRLQWDVAFYQRYCSNCGQKLDWSD